MTINFEFFTVLGAVATVIACVIAYRQLFPAQTSPLPLIEDVGAWWYEKANDWYVIRLKLTNRDDVPIRFETALLRLPVGGKIITETKIPKEGPSYDPGDPIFDKIPQSELSNHTTMWSSLAPKGTRGNALIAGTSDFSFEVLWIKFPPAQSKRERFSIDLIFRASDVNAKQKKITLSREVSPRMPIARD
jgi:hypothetical protein